MDNDNWLGRLLSLFTVPAAVWAGLLAACVAWVRTRPLIIRALSERHRDREVAETADWARLRDEIGRLDQRIKNLEEENERCRKDLADVRDKLSSERAERLRFERLLQASGEIKQAEAIAAAEVRRDMRQQPEGDKK